MTDTNEALRLARDVQRHCLEAEWSGRQFNREVALARAYLALRAENERLQTRLNERRPYSDKLAVIDGQVKEIARLSAVITAGWSDRNREIERLRAELADEKYKRETAEGLERMALDQRDKVWAELETARKALRELVACKDIHDKLERIEVKDLSAPRNYRAEELREEYDRRKPLAWAAARSAAAEKGAKG